MSIFSRFFSNRGIANSKLFLIGLVTVIGPWSIYILSVNLAEKRRLLLKGKKDEEISDKTSVALEQKIVETSVVSPESDARKILIIYGTCTGTAKKFAEECSQKCKTIFSADDVNTVVVDAKDYDEFVLDQEDIVLFICSTWTDGVAPESAQRLVTSLIDYASDFRVSKSHLAKVKFAVFGLGGSDYNKYFCKAAKDINGENKKMSGYLEVELTKLTKVANTIFGRNHIISSDKRAISR